MKNRPLILSCWPMMLEADVGSMAVEAGHFHQYSVTFCCCVTDGSRGAVWQSGVWLGSMYEAKVCHWIPPCSKNGIHWHSSMLVECLWRPNSGCEHSEAVVGAFQQWWQQCERQAMFLPDGHAQLSHHKIKSASISSSTQISRLQPEICVQNWVLASMHWKQQ